MKNKIFRKVLAVGIIFLSLCFVNIPIIDSQANSFNSKFIKSSVYSTLDKYKDIKVSLFAVERLIGEIKDFETLGEHNYHFDIIKLVDSYIYIIFLWGIMPLPPVYQRGVYKDAECFFKLEGNYQFIKEEITGNHIDIIYTWWDEFYIPSLN